MLKLGLTGAQHRLFEATLATHHEIRPRINVLNLNNQLRRGMSPLLIDGQVDVDGHADEASRTATVQLADPDRTMNFDPDAPDDSVIYRNRHMRIFRDVLVPTVGWVEVPLITGPCTGFNRNGGLVDIEVSSAEYDWSTRNTWEPLKLHKGTQITDCIKKIIRQRCSGTVKIQIPDLNGKKFRLSKDKTLKRMSHPWQQAKHLAKSIDRQLYVDAYGHIRMRRVSHGKPVFIFRDGEGGMIETDPTRSFGDEDFFNGHLSIGRVLKAAKEPLEAWAFLPRDHPLSPWTLATGGCVHRKVNESSNPGFREPKGILEYTQRRLHEDAEEAVATGWESLVVPHLEPGDRVGVRTRAFNGNYNQWTFSIPLLPEGTQTNGFNDQVSYGKTRGGPSHTRKPVFKASSSAVQPIGDVKHPNKGGKPEAHHIKHHPKKQAHPKKHHQGRHHA
jgi:hypothetical protein